MTDEMKSAADAVLSAVLIRDDDPEWRSNKLYPALDAYALTAVKEAREEERDTIEPLWLGALAARGLASVAMEVAEEVRDMRKRLTPPTEGLDPEDYGLTGAELSTDAG